MTLFISLPGRRYEISDAYVMALTFIITFSVTKIVMQVLEKRKKKKKEIQKINELRGGNLKLKLSDENELGLAILSCIADNEKYLVTNPRIKELIFSLAKEKIKQESLVLTPNLIRFFALKLIDEDQTLIVKIGNLVVSSSNRARLITRTIASIVIASVAAISSLTSYGVLMAVIFFIETENCGYNCDTHFQKLPRNEPIEIYEERPNGHLVIAGNDDARQVEIYIPSQSANEVIETNKQAGEKVVTKSYRPARKKAKQVKFSEFRKTDPILSQFESLEEPYVPNKSCSIKDGIDTGID